MSDIVVVTLLVATLLTIVATTQSVATKWQISPTILLAAVGVALGSLAAFLLYTPLTNAFNEMVAPLVQMPVRSQVFLYVFLPLLLFQASLSLEVRRVMEDAVPILVLAVVAVILAAAVIGFSLEALFGVPLAVALLLGAIVATTDPAAVVAIFRDIGAPGRLSRLVEGESLLNDAAAIALFTLLLSVIISGQPLDLGEASFQFMLSFAGGALAGVAGGRLLVFAIPFMRGIRAAEVTLTIGATYLIYIAADQVVGVSGVVAVVVAGVTVRATITAHINPINLQHLFNVWEQVAFWAGSLIFLLAAILVPRILTGFSVTDLLIVLTVVVAALVARAIVLFGVMPLLARLRLAAPVSAPYSVTILWGGLRGAVTLALALAVTENRLLDPETKRFVAVTATGYVLFTLFVNGLTLRRLIRWLKLDRLSPVDVAVRDQVVALALADVIDHVRSTAERYGIEPRTTRPVVGQYEELRRDLSEGSLEQTLGDKERLTLGLIAVAAREGELILDHHEQHTLATDVVARMLRDAERMLEGARSGGRSGYSRAAKATLEFGTAFRFAHLMNRYVGLEFLLKREIAQRFETLLVQSLVLTELRSFVRRRITPLLGTRIAGILDEIVSGRASGTNSALDALRLQYPEYAESLERVFLRQVGDRHELAHYEDLRKEGLISRELYEDLRRKVHVGRPPAKRTTAALDLRMRATELIRSVPLFAHLDEKQVERLGKSLRPRYVLPGQHVIRTGETNLALYFIASGAVEVQRGAQAIRLGPGDFFGEMALLSGRARTADVVAISFCHLLVLSEEDFLFFLNSHPEVRREIERTARERASLNRTF